MNPPQSKTNVPAKTFRFQTMARLAAALLLAALLVPSASAQSQYIYVANTNENTVSKIDINSNTEVARYATWFSTAFGPAPSRIVQDSAKNVFVLDRFFNPSHLPVLLKIAPTGGIPGTLGNDTSNGPTNVLAITDTTPNNKIDSGEATDVRILWGNDIGTVGVDEGALGRALCMDPSGVLWVGLHSVGTTGTGKYYRVDATNGQLLPPLTGVPVPNGFRPYGCQVDTKGRLWSVDGGNQLVEIDTTVSPYPATRRDHSTPTDFGVNYSLSLFNGCGSEPTKVYLSGRGRPPTTTAKTYIVYDPQAPPATAFGNPPLGNPPVPQFESIAVAVDLNGDIISGEYRTGRVIKSDRLGNLVWDTGTPLVGSVGHTNDLHGLIIDENNDIWAVHFDKNRVVKYNSTNPQNPIEVKVGAGPYTYGNPPPPTCPCAQTSEPQLKCEGKDAEGKWKYSWSFVVTNHSPFSAPATTVNISLPNGSPVTDLTPPGNPGQFALTPNLAQNGQATVSGTFTLAQPMPGTKICLEIRLNAGDGWCCPLERVCFTVPDCACASLQGTFRCNHGQRILDLSVTNLGPTAAQGAQIISNTPGVTVSPQNTTLAFPQNTPVIITPLTVTGATPGQVISLSVMLHGPIDPRTGVYSWCCTATVKVTYPTRVCWWWIDGELFDDVNANGIRDSGEGGLADWTVTLTNGKAAPRTTTSNESGAYHFEEIEPAALRVTVQPPKGWRATTPKGGAYSLSVEAPPKGKLDFGFTKTR